MNKVAIYARLSEDDYNGKEMSTSVDYQIKTLVKYCIDKELGEYEVYADDCFSGKDFNRPSFQRMLKDIKLGKVIKSLVHEYRHLYQYIVIQMHEDHPLHKSWSNNFNNVINWDTLNNDQADYEKYVLQPLEIDSYAYTKYFFEHYLEMPINMFNGQLDDVLNEYIEIIISNGL